LQFLRLRSLDSHNQWVDFAFIQLQSRYFHVHADPNVEPQAMAVRELQRLALMYDLSLIVGRAQVMRA
jgi:hypothetical protein